MLTVKSIYINAVQFLLVASLLILSACGGGSNSITLPSSIPVPLKAKFASDNLGNLYFADTSNYIIVKVDTSGNATLFAGTLGFQGVRDGVGGKAEFYSPNDIAVDVNGNVYVTDSLKYDCVSCANNVYSSAMVLRAAIRKITPAGVVTTLAGSATAGSVSDIGTTDGIGTSARFLNPQGITTDNNGNVYVADYGNNCIRKIDSSGMVSTYGGKLGQQGIKDGTRDEALFYHPMEIKSDGAGSLYVLHTSGVGSQVRKINPDGSVVTLGTGLHADNLVVNTNTHTLYAVSQFDQGATKNKLFAISSVGQEVITGLTFPSTPWTIAFIPNNSIATLLNGVISKYVIP